MARSVDWPLRLVGAVVATGLGAVTGLYEAFLVPVHLPHSSVHVPVSLLLALVGNPLLAWFAYAATGRRVAGLLPAIAWSAVWFVAASRTREGDLVIVSSNWVGLVTLFLGPAAFAAGVLLAPITGKRAWLRDQSTPISP
jgi:hypothetical protein